MRGEQEVAGRETRIRRRNSPSKPQCLASRPWPTFEGHGCLSDERPLESAEQNVERSDDVVDLRLLRRGLLRKDREVPSDSLLEVALNQVDLLDGDALIKLDL